LQQFIVRGPVPVLVAALALGSAASASAAAPEDIAREHVSAHAATFGVQAGDVAQMSVLSSYKTPGTGVTHVSLVQRHEGYDVFDSQVTVNIGRDGRIVFAGGSLVKGLHAGAAPATLDVTDAVEAAASALGLDDPAGLRVTESKAQQRVVSGGGISASPIPAKLGWQPATDGSLRLAWRVEIDAATESQRWNATVDARSGRLLRAEDLVIHDQVDELESSLSRRGISPNFAPPAFTLVTPNPVLDGSSYRALGFPTESFNDADRTVVTTPADAGSSPFGWHDTDGVAGPEYTITRGNNAHAFMDQDADNQPDPNSSPEGGAALKFDFGVDLTEHAQTYKDAATTNLFYANNMIHDLAWRYGFDEASGNFQSNNYGRGGTGGDYVRAEAADGNGTNNANFNPPTNDGGSPRMQMYLWPGNQLGSQNTIAITGGATYGATWSRFTPAVTKAGVAGTFVYGGTGCEAALYPAPPATPNWIALVDGGTDEPLCSFVKRAQVAEALGARALVVAHNDTGNAPIVGGEMTVPPVTIPAVAVTQANGAALKAAVAAGPTAATLQKNPQHPGIRDGDLENGIILHEYTHGISSRLTGGVGNNCLGGNEQAGEGWSDYMALTLLLDPALDDPEAARGMGPYALFQADRHGNGIRPRPYSRNMNIQPFTYDSIKSNGWLNGGSLALPHGLGHGWASVLWDLDWDLIDKYGFNRNLYAAWNTAGNTRALQYVMDGLKMQGCNPGLVVARAAIIAAASERNNGDADTCTLWATFARRGLGYSAVQGTTNRNDNDEAFDTHPDCLRGFEGVAAEPALTTVAAGAPLELRFTADNGYRGLDVATKNNPYTRQVDCQTLKTVTPGQVAITPRPVPVPAVTRGGAPLSVDAAGVYHYPWQTDVAWGNTCREFVLTTKAGVQHRAFFRLLAATHVDTGPGGSVPATLAVTLGAPATFAPFTPGVTRDYDASMSANVISTAASAALSVSDPSATATGRLVNGTFSLPAPLLTRATSAGGTGGALAAVGGSASPTTVLNYAGPVSNDAVTLAFRQSIAASDALRTGTYSKTLTLTLSTTEP
jgi:hypothetical protein